MRPVLAQTASQAMPRAVARSGDRASRAGRWRYLPLGLGLGYLLASYLAFLLWPVDWPIPEAAEWFRLSAYVLTCFAAVAGGYLWGVRGRPRTGRLRHRRRIFYVGAALSIVLLVPLTTIQTGRSIFDLMDAFADQKQAYLMFQGQVSLSGGANPLASLVSACAAPFIFAVTPLAVLHFRAMSWPTRLLALATVLCSLALSVMRGTDREVANLFIVGGGALMVSVARDNAATVNATLKLIRRYWLATLLVVVFAVVGADVTTARKAGRLGGVSSACLGENHICADLTARGLSWMTNRQRFGASIFIMSAAQGYYGLDLALQKDFRPTWGIGHSQAVASLYQRITGRTDLQLDAYTYRNSFDGWSDQNFWSTLMTWIANDIGFPGAVIFVGVVGLLWGRAWRDATRGSDDRAAIVFCVLSIMIAYLPANNQLFMSFDGYFTLLFWLAEWLLFGRRTPVAAARPGSA